MSAVVTVYTEFGTHTISTLAEADELLASGKISEAGAEEVRKVLQNVYIGGTKIEPSPESILLNKVESVRPKKRPMNPILAAERKKPGSGRVKLLALLNASRWSANMAATKLKCSVWSILRMVQRFDLSEEWAGRTEKPNHWSKM